MKIWSKLRYFGIVCPTTAIQYTYPDDIKPVSIEHWPSAACCQFCSSLAMLAVSSLCVSIKHTFIGYNWNCINSSLPIHYIAPPHSPKICHFSWGVGILGQPDPSPQTASWSSQAFLKNTRSLESLPKYQQAVTDSSSAATRLTVAKPSPSCFRVQTDPRDALHQHHAVHTSRCIVSLILFFYSFIVTVCVCHTALKGYLLTYFTYLHS